MASRPEHSIAVRAATGADGGACAAIYAPYVRETAITFELQPPTGAQMAERIAASAERHAWLVAERAGTVIGYAYGGRFAARPAYRFSCEVSIYVDGEARGAGAGRALYTALFERLAERGYRTAAAGMTLPNEASAALHRAMGFEQIGVFRRIGYKLGRWHDVAWLQRTLAEGPDPPAEPH